MFENVKYKLEHMCEYLVIVELINGRMTFLLFAVLGLCEGRGMGEA